MRPGSLWRGRIENGMERSVKTGPIKKGWDSYLKSVVNPKNNAEQIAEMRRVFYAGAMVSFVAYRNVGEDHVTEEDGVEILMAMQEEIEGFQEELRAGAGISRQAN